MSQRVQLQAVQLGSPRHQAEGLRLGTVRLLPRGIRKQDYARLNYFDVWLPNLAPSRELLASWKKGQISVARFFARYRAEMKQTEPRQLIRLLAAVAKTTPIAVGCYCEDESRCHRSVLEQLIRDAAKS